MIFAIVYACTAVFVMAFVLVGFSCDDIKKWRKTKKLKFNTFLRFYNIAPYKWSLYSGTVEYKTDNYGHGIYFYEFFRFSIIDTVRYYLWKKRDTKRKEAQKQNEEMAEFLECIKKDIEEFQEKNKQEVSEGLNEIWRK